MGGCRLLVERQADLDRIVVGMVRIVDREHQATRIHGVPVTHHLVVLAQSARVPRGDTYEADHRQTARVDIRPNPGPLVTHHHPSMAASSQETAPPARGGGPE